MTSLCATVVIKWGVKTAFVSLLEHPKKIKY